MHPATAAAAAALSIWTLGFAANAAPAPPDGVGAPFLGLPSTPGLSIAPPATPQQIAAARAEGEAMLSRAGAQDLFENVTFTASPALRHKASGLTCVFAPGSPINQVLVFHSPRGDGVGCNTGRDSRSDSVFLDRASPQLPPLEQLVAALGAAIPKRFPDAKRAPMVMTATGKDAHGNPLPPHRAVVYVRPGPAGPIVEREDLAVTPPGHGERGLLGVQAEYLKDFAEMRCR